MSVKGLLIISVVFVVLAVGLWFLADYFLTLPDHVSQHETHIIGQDRFEPGSEAHVRVIVRDSSTGSPLPNSKVKVSLQTMDGESAIPLYEGSVDEIGSVDVTFQAPEDTKEDGSLIFQNANLVVESESDLGSDQLTHPIAIDRDFRILLTTDKPVYQPGQIIHMRALALSTFDLSPVSDQKLEFIIADGKGNKVFRKTLITSEYGVAFADFQLASEVNTGNYKISAVLGNTTTEKTVTVEYYTLPKFEIELSSDKSSYLPASRVEGSLRTNYFFGKPVDGGSVLLEGYTFDVERIDHFNLQGTTDQDGNFTFEFDLPDYIAGTDLERGLGQFHLQASVTDRANHTETTDITLLVSENPIIIDAIPESGQLQPGIENILYILTSQPDGTPIQCDLSISYSAQYPNIEIQTDPFGLAAVRLTPESRTFSFSVEAFSSNGDFASRLFEFVGEDSLDEYLLLRPDKPTYRVGETMNLAIFSSQEKGTAYLDIVRQGQTLSTRSVSIGENPEIGTGRALVALDLSPDLYGTLELHVYKILPGGIITRDTRMIVVDPAADLNVVMDLDEESYLPGSSANLEIQVNDHAGAGKQAAIGLAIVDESVFSIAQQDPGFAKLYYMLEEEIRQPRYDLHGFKVGDFLTYEESQEMDSTLFAARENTAQAALADAVADKIAFALDTNSHDAVVQRLASRQIDFFEAFFGWSFLLPIGFLLMSLYAAWHEERLTVSISVAITGIVALPFIMCPLLFVVDEDSLPVIWGILGIALFLLAFFAFRQSSWPRLVGMGLMLLYTLVLYSLLQAGFQSLFSMDFGPGVAFLLGLIAVYAAFLIQLSSANWKGLLSRSAITSILILGLFLGSCASMPDIPFMGAEEAFVESPIADAPLEQEETSSEEPRLRQYFPETLLWLPDGETDRDGYLDLEIPIADSITTWRMTALASSLDGELGNTVGELLVFQDFFIDLDLPQALTVGDEVSVPVSIYNYLQEPQDVRLTVRESSWFELLDESQKELEVKSNEVSVLYFRIRAVDVGTHPFRVTARGSKLSDAIQRSIRVFPDGKAFTFSQSDRLSKGITLLPIEFPSNALPEPRSVTVKLYPGIASQVVEGLDSLLRLPYGCFEQTSSTTYPNILILDYMKTTGQLSPEVQFKAEEYINLGYQRLLTFEVSGGGFSLFGRSPADRMLTAYGLQEFNDMSRVHPVDPAILERTAEWLFSQQESDGSWGHDRGLVHESAWGTSSANRLPSTAYIAWGLIDAGFANDPRTSRSIKFLRDGQAQASSPYVLSLIANALVAYDKKASDGITASTNVVLDRLASLATVEQETAFWTSEVSTYMGSYGTTANIETTALASLALIRASRHPELASGGLTTLVQAKDAHGTWHTTQATILSLKALLAGTYYQGENTDATLSVSLNDGQAYTLRLTPENFDVVQMVVFDSQSLEEVNSLEITSSGVGDLMYQVSGSYYVPWNEVLSSDAGGEVDPISIDLQYDRTELALDDLLTADVSVSLTTPLSQVEWAIIDLGIPPGFSVERQSLDDLVEISQSQSSEENGFPALERYEFTSRQIILYISDLSFEHPLSFSYQLSAKYPIRAQTPASTVYDYYNPEISAEQAPVEIVVIQ
jgi:uncharacterized protein YfaS (alpha-2-macroglobulin family)